MDQASGESQHGGYLQVEPPRFFSGRARDLLLRPHYHFPLILSFGLSFSIFPFICLVAAETEERKRKLYFSSLKLSQAPEFLFLLFFSVLLFWKSNGAGGGFFYIYFKHVKVEAGAAFLFLLIFLLKFINFQATYVLEEGDPVAVAVHPSGDELVCSTTAGDCK